jgi:hypothetical protein
MKAATETGLPTNNDENDKEDTEGHCVDEIEPKANAGVV